MEAAVERNEIPLLERIEGCVSAIQALKLQRRPAQGQFEDLDYGMKLLLTELFSEELGGVTQSQFFGFYKRLLDLGFSDDNKTIIQFNLTFAYLKYAFNKFGHSTGQMAQTLLHTLAGYYNLYYGLTERTLSQSAPEAWETDDVGLIKPLQDAHAAYDRAIANLEHQGRARGRSFAGEARQPKHREVGRLALMADGESDVGRQVAPPPAVDFPVPPPIPSVPPPPPPSGPPGPPTVSPPRPPSFKRQRRHSVAAILRSDPVPPLPSPRPVEMVVLPPPPPVHAPIAQPLPMDLFYIPQGMLTMHKRQLRDEMQGLKKRLLKYVMSQGGMSSALLARRDIDFRLHSEGDREGPLVKLFKELTNNPARAHEALSKLRYLFVTAPDIFYIDQYTHLLREVIDGPIVSRSMIPGAGTLTFYHDPQLGTHLALELAVALLQKYRMLRDHGVVDEILHTPLMAFMIQSGDFDDVLPHMRPEFVAAQRASYGQGDYSFCVDPEHYEFTSKVRKMLRDGLKKLQACFAHPDCNDVKLKNWAAQLGLGLRESPLAGVALQHAFIEAYTSRTTGDIVAALIRPGYSLQILQQLPSHDVLEQNEGNYILLDNGTLFCVGLSATPHVIAEDQHLEICTRLQHANLIQSGLVSRDLIYLTPDELREHVLKGINHAPEDPCAELAKKVLCRARWGQSISAGLILGTIVGVLAIIDLCFLGVPAPALPAPSPSPLPSASPVASPLPCNNVFNATIIHLVKGFCDLVVTTGGAAGNLLNPGGYAKVEIQGKFVGFPPSEVYYPNNGTLVLTEPSSQFTATIQCLTDSCRGAFFPVGVAGQSCNELVSYVCANNAEVSSSTKLSILAGLAEVAGPSRLGEMLLCVAMLALVVAFVARCSSLVFGRNLDGGRQRDDLDPHHGPGRI